MSFQGRATVRRYFSLFIKILYEFTGGRGGIRTLDTLSRIHAFQACALNHSATLPLDHTSLEFQGSRAQSISLKSGGTVRLLSREDTRSLDCAAHYSQSAVRFKCELRGMMASWRPSSNRWVNARSESESLDFTRRIEQEVREIGGAERWLNLKADLPYGIAITAAAIVVPFPGTWWTHRRGKAPIQIRLISLPRGPSCQIQHSFFCPQAAVAAPSRSSP